MDGPVCGTGGERLRFLRYHGWTTLGKFGASVPAASRGMPRHSASSSCCSHRRCHTPFETSRQAGAFSGSPPLINSERQLFLLGCLFASEDEKVITMRDDNRFSKLLVVTIYDTLIERPFDVILIELQVIIVSQTRNLWFQSAFSLCSERIPRPLTGAGSSGTVFS